VKRNLWGYMMEIIYGRLCMYTVLALDGGKRSASTDNKIGIYPVALTTAQRAIFRIGKYK